MVVWRPFWSSPCWLLTHVSTAGENVRPHQRRRRHGGDGRGAATNEGARYEWGLYLPSAVSFLQPQTLNQRLWRLPSQVDSNKDRLVSLQEFLVATNKKEFLEPDSWEVSGDRKKTQNIGFLLPKTCILDRPWSRTRPTLRRRWGSLRSTWPSRSKTSTWKQWTCRNRGRSWRDSRHSWMRRKLSCNRYQEQVFGSKLQNVSLFLYFHNGIIVLTRRMTSLSCLVLDRSSVWQQHSSWATKSQRVELMVSNHCWIQSHFV